MKAFVVFAIMLMASSAYADVYGTAIVHDGDTLKINGQSVRLDGIDAPELRQKCMRDGVEWSCGLESMRLLASMAEGREVVCVGSKFDRYRRLIGTCFVGDSNMNEQMVRRGLALDYFYYSKGKYAAAETTANDEDVGMWAGTFVKPWDWRKGVR